MMSAPTIIVGIGKTENGYVVFDQLRRQHYAADERALAAVLAQLCNDDEIPKTERIDPTQAKVREAAVKIAKQVAPKYADLAEPVVDGIEAFAKFVHSKITKESSEAAKPKPPPEPKRRMPPLSRTRAPKAEGQR
jgi:hypothetical protein